METPCTFPSDVLQLEGLLDQGPQDRAVIITHPHPLYGGDMHNPVVDTVRQAYRDRGFATLRFNFRGTGQSEGSHDQGRGEVRDILAARSFLTGRGYSVVDLAGYSFGAFVSLTAVAQNPRDFSRLVLISPPVDFIEFADLSGIEALSLVISGEHDDYASPAHIKKLLKNWNKHAIFIEIPGADHFYSGHLGRVGETLAGQL
ncbi:Dot/Icm type IV secretion system effector CoxH3 [Desulfatiferula olefinivorans]